MATTEKKISEPTMERAIMMIEHLTCFVENDHVRNKAIENLAELKQEEMIIDLVQSWITTRMHIYHEAMDEFKAKNEPVPSNIWEPFHEFAKLEAFIKKQQNK